MSTDAKQLVARCADIHAAAGDAIGWIGDVRKTSQRLDSDSDGLIIKLRKVRNLVRRLGRAAARPMSVGFFGISQAGKSYLISALAAGGNGHLETLLDNQQLDFIEHVDPGGKGGEATGLVTRFTRRAVDAPPGYPIQLTLFAEVDLVKVLGNAFFNDFDHTKLSYDNDPESIRSKVLSGLEKRRRQQPVSGMTEDDVVDLMEYFQKRFPTLMKPLLGDFWPTAIDLAPRLLPDDRAQLFSVLWGGIEEMSEAYLMLRGALEEVEHAELCYCPISVLVHASESGGLSKSKSIMNVDILDRLGKDHADLIEVIPVASDGTMGRARGVPRSILAAVTTELRFVLAEPPAVSTVEHVDLLDFPGYRGRLSVTDINQVSDQENQGSAIAQLILRGKVACLFERYTDDQEMNVLVLCTPSDKQSDVNDIGPVLDTWIAATQGEKPEIRARRLPGLAWAMTRFDMRIDSMLQDSLENARGAWAKMMKMVLERFKQFEWVDSWGSDQPFNNTYIVRKPKMETKWLSLEGENETGVKESKSGQIGLLKETFIGDDTVQKHFVDPALAWDAMVKLNDGGITRLADYLAGAARIELKLERIREQLDEETRDVAEQRLGAYFQKEGAAELEQKQRIVKAVQADLRTPKRLARFGELLKSLQPSTEQLRARYLRIGEVPVEESDAAANGAQKAVVEDEEEGLFGLDDLVVLPDAGPASAAPAVANLSTGAAQFAKAAMRDWTTQLRGLSDNADLMHFLAADTKIIRNLTDELITGASRLKVEQRIVEHIQEAEERTSAKRSSLVERQVMTTANCINDFVDYLGVSALPVNERSASTVAPQRKVFQPPVEVPIGKLPELPPKPINFSGLFIVDWLDAFARLAIDNAGHSAGREITPEQNERLGQILAQMKRGAAVSAE